MDKLKILFVGTATISKNHNYYLRTKTVAEMVDIFDKKGLYHIFTFLLLKNCVEFYYEIDDDIISSTINDIHNFYGKYRTIIEIDTENIPGEYILHFAKEERQHDLIDNFELVANNIKKLFPKVTKCNYTTIDPQIYEPHFYGLQNKCNEINGELSKKYNLIMNYDGHHKLSFQKFIKENKTKYDIIWFFGCCNPHYCIETDNKYWNNFLGSIKKNGFILYADPIPTERYQFGLISIKKRVVKFNLNVDDIERINFFCDKLNMIDKGIYKIK